MLYSYKGSKWIDKKKRKEFSGWTYSEMQKTWRMTNRENKLDKECKRVSFKEWQEGLVTITYR